MWHLKSETMNTRLEYSPLTGTFNLAQASDQSDTEKGYKTLCCFINTQRAERFIHAMEHRYPQLSGRCHDAFPSVADMKSELYFFIDEDIRLLEQHMTSTFKRRALIFNAQV